MAGDSRRTVIKIDNVIKKYNTRNGEVPVSYTHLSKQETVVAEL